MECEDYSINNDTSDHEEIKFGVGYKFQNEKMKGGERFLLDAVVKALGKRSGDRLVQYVDSDEESELLHIDDIEYMPELPRHNYSLRVGDKIKYKQILFPYGYVTKIIIAIEDNCYGVLSVRTNGMENMDEEHNDMFELVEASVHSDAPPVGKWMSINKVNLIRGDIRKSTKSTNERNRINDETIKDTPGSEMAVMAVAVAKTMKKMRVLGYRDEMASTLTPGSWVIYKSTEEDQPFWLGKTVSKKEWKGNCIWKNDSNETKEFDGVLILACSFAVNVQWYTQKTYGVLEYKIEPEEPSVQATVNLIKIGFDEQIATVRGGKVRSKRDRILWEMEEKVGDDAMDIIKKGDNWTPTKGMDNNDVDGDEK